MKKIFLLLCVFTIFINCENKKNKSQITENQDYEQIKNESFKIKNPNDYSVDFINQLKKQNLDNVILDKNKITIDGQTMTFPENPVFGKSIVLSGKKDNLTITLTLSRKNQTTINYTIAMLEKNKGLTKFQGEATIAATFYLGLESDESSLSKLMYPADEYLAKEGECFTAIRVGKEQESGKMLLGKLIKNCNKTIQDIDLDNFPTLIEQVGNFK